jgi:hypothetical protein
VASSVLLPFRSNAATSLGPSHVPAGAGSSKLSFAAQLQAASSSSDACRHQDSTTLHQHAGTHLATASSSAAAGVGSLGSLHSHDTGFQLHSRLSQLDDVGMQHRRTFGSSLMQAGQQLCGHSLYDQEGGSEGDWHLAGSAAAGWGAGCDVLAGAGSSGAEAEGTLPWYEEQMQEVSVHCVHLSVLDS